MTAPTIRPNLYLTKAKEELQKLDPIKREVAIPFKKANEMAKSALDYMEDSKDVLMSFDRIKEVMERDDGLGLDFSAVKGRVEQAMGAAGKLTKVAGGIQDSIANQMAIAKGYANTAMGYIDQGKGMIDEAKGFARDAKGQLLSYKENVGATINGVFKTIEGGVLADVQAVMGTVNGFVEDGMGFIKSFDLTAQVAFIKGTAEKLMDWDMPEVITKAVDAIKDVNLKDSIFGEIMVKAAALGDLPMVKYFKDKVSAGYKYIVGNVSATKLLENFKVIPKLGESLKDLGIELVSTLDEVHPDWASDLKDIAIKRIGPLAGASVDALAALAKTDTHRGLALAAGTVVREDVETIIRRQYPHARY